MALRATRRAALACSRGQAGLDARVAAVLGGQWGDEGKGKLADVLAKNYDVVGRFNGGANAGCVVKTQVSLCVPLFHHRDVHFCSRLLSSPRPRARLLAIVGCWHCQNDEEKRPFATLMAR